MADTALSTLPLAVSSRSDFVAVCESCPQVPYIELKIPQDFKSLRRLVFKTCSRDQGWADGPPSGGADWSCSIFVAELAPVGRRQHSAPKVVLANDHAVPEPHDHVVAWDLTDETDAATVQWLRMIKAGDLVQLFPIARSQGWENCVYSASIELYGERIDSDDLASLLPFTVAQQSSIYSSLDADQQEIRVLNLLPSSSDNELDLELEHVFLTSPTRPAFHALSYCWGTALEVKRVRIRVKGRTDAWTDMNIGSNLYRALLHTVTGRGPVTKLWADAICINQDDLEERAQQVSIMHEIYSQAEQVIIWTGESNPDVDRQISTIREICDRHENIEGSVVDAGGTSITAWEASHRQDSAIHQYLRHSPLFRYDWFFRVWVVQEVYHAREAVLHCGQHEIEWSVILRVAQCLASDRLAPNRKTIPGELLPPIFRSLFLLQRTADDGRGRARYARAELQSDILDMIIAGTDLDATDPRDKIFALLNISRSSIGDSIPDQIRPDYTKPVEVVYRDFTKWWIQTTHSLRILSAVHLNKGRTWLHWSKASLSPRPAALPTWSFWYEGYGRWARATLGLSPDCEYRAAGDTKASLLSTDDLRCLILDGILVDRIETTTVFPVAIPYMRKNVDDPMLKAYYNIFEPLLQGGGWAYSGSWAGQYTNTRDPIDWEQHNDGLVWHFQTHRQDMQRTGGLQCHGKCYLKSARGIMGLCPATAMIGDLIVVLFGGKVPFLLRPVAPDREDEFELIGECFLNEYMHGKALEDDTCTRRSFCLI